jgi:dienelactone hydrolase
VEIEYKEKKQDMDSLLSRFRKTKILAFSPLFVITVLACAATLLFPDVAQAAASIKTMGVSFYGDGGVLLHGTIYAPAAPGRYPGLVMIDGAGPTSSNEFHDEARAFAERGIVTLVYTKRTVGYSTFQRDFAVLAKDALSGMALVRARADVNPSMIGLFGLSEGAWVAPLAAAMQPGAVAYIVTVGAVGLTPIRETVWSWDEFLIHAGVSGSLTQTMFRGARLFEALGLFPEASYNTVPVWEHIHQPVLLMWGDLDRYAASAESSQIIEQALDQGHNAHYTIRFFPNAAHELHITQNDGFDHLGGLAPGFADTVSSWVNNLSHGLPQVSIEAAPREDNGSFPVTPLRWYETAWAQIAALFFMILVFGGYPLVALVRRLSHRQGPKILQPSMRWLAACGFVSIAGFWMYLLFLGITGVNIIGPVILGNPIPWLILHLTAAAAIMAAVWMSVTWYRHRGEITNGYIQFGLLVAASATFIIWGVYWGLLLP